MTRKFIVPIILILIIFVAGCTIDGNAIKIPKTQKESKSFFSKFLGLFSIGVKSCGPDEVGYCTKPNENCEGGYNSIGADTCKPEKKVQCCVPKPAEICGDGICEGDENCSVCPSDCGACPIANYEESPFAFQNARITRNSTNPLEIWANYPFYLKDLNVHWTRLVGYSAFNWEFAQKSAISKFNWSKFDEDIKDVQKNNVLVLIAIQPFARWDQLSCYTKEYLMEHKGNPFSKILPCDLEAYSKFVKAVIERYDGDGINDMLGLKYAQQYWMIGDEPDHPEFWKDTPERFATLFATSYKAIKESDPTAKVHMGGTAGCIESYFYREEEISEATMPWNCREIGKDGFFIRVFTELERLGGTFDIHSVDFHLFGNAGDYKKIKNFSVYINRMTQDFGYGNLPLWSTEMGTFSGEATSPSTGQHGMITYQSETEQAQELLKRYVYGLAWGVKKSFWEAIIAEQTDYFPRISLMDETETKKLSYYTYKLMVEKLEGSDWNNIQTIQESDDIYIYKFTKKDTNKPIWVAWNDGAERQITISSITSSQVKKTEAVPKYETGKEVTDYNTAFNTEIKTVNNGQVTLTLGITPVFVEET